MNPRTCIVTRLEKQPGEMVRFVLDGDMNVVPDLKRKLPGRGVWVSANRKHVEEAVRKGHFSRGFKQKAIAETHLPELVASLLKSEALSTLALARKAGQLVAGRARVEELIKTGKAALLIHAGGSSGDGRRKLDKLSDRMTEKGHVFEIFETAELDRVAGRANTVHLAVTEGGLAEKIKTSVVKLLRYEDSGHTEN